MGQIKRSRWVQISPINFWLPSYRKPKNTQMKWWPRSTVLKMELSNTQNVMRFLSRIGASFRKGHWISILRFGEGGHWSHERIGRAKQKVDHKEIRLGSYYSFYWTKRVEEWRHSPSGASRGKEEIGERRRITCAFGIVKRQFIVSFFSQMIKCPMRPIWTSQ